MGERATAINVTLYSEDLKELDVVAGLYGGNRSLAVRLFIDFWRQNRDPGDSRQLDRIRALVEAYYRENITAQEFAIETGLVMLAGK